MNQPLIVKTNIVGVEKVMALAGLHHVVRARQAIFNRLAGHMRQQGCNATERGGLGFFTAKAATHAAHLGLNRMNRQPQHLSHQFLDFRRVLAGGMYEHATVLLGLDHRGLALQIKVLLPAHVDLAFQAMRRGRQRLIRIATQLPMARPHEE